MLEDREDVGHCKVQERLTNYVVVVRVLEF